MTIDEFIEKCQKRPLPNNPMDKLRLLARDLADGASRHIWETKIYILSSDEKPNAFTPVNDNISTYLIGVWDDPHIDISLLKANNYYENEIGLTEKAFSLLEEAEDASVFISYKRSESSAFALLINDRLKQHGIEPFVDMQLQAGEDWRVELERNIKNSDYFIILLGNETLQSVVTIQEIQWAVDADVTLIPIWHNGFKFNAKDWSDLPDEISQALSSTHTIRVLEENPLTYDTALRELLNRFGVSI